MNELLNSVNSPSDLKKLTHSQLKDYASEVREYIIESVNNKGGHLASNLGTVELSIALHYVFDCPTDKILWDVGHQSYTHKIITGRRDGFANLRENGGISGFPKISESEYDAFTMGHASTSLSLGLGLARAREINGEDYKIVSVIGDGAFTGGMAFEAVNDIGASHAKMIIILNDNKMSISKNVGAFSNYLAKLRLSKSYVTLKYNIKKGAQALPFFGDKIYSALDKTKDTVKSLFQTNKMFEALGIKYYGPFDGHNILNIIQILQQVKDEERPVILHMVTDKGRGYLDAENNPSKFHGVAPVASVCENSFGKILSEFLLNNAPINPKIVAITAAMKDGTGLNEFGDKYPERCLDVGIAEQHAVTLAAGLAAGGCKPYFAVYSTFLQRAYDQILHDVCINNLPVTFCIDRAGTIGADGVTHQGLFDLSYLTSIPNMTVCAPKDGQEFYNILEWSKSFNAPLSIRYPKSFEQKFKTCDSIILGKWEVIKTAKSNIYILACGNRMLGLGDKIDNVTLVNARFVKPLDTKYLDTINKKGNLIITLEDNVLKGGFGESVLSYLNTLGLKAKINSLGYPDKFIDNYNLDNSFLENGITKKAIEEIIKIYLVLT